MTAIKRAALPASQRGNDPNDHRDDPTYLGRVEHPDPLDWTSEFTVSKAEAEQMIDPKFAYNNLIIEGHVGAYVSPPNGGKTTIMMHVSGEIAPQYRVIYVNADTGAGDAKRMIRQAEAGGFTLLLPDMKVGLSMADVVARLEAMSASDSDLKQVVFIFDTLKKMTDVISKAQSKRLYGLLRSLSAKGATVALLAHTNKYKDADGKPIYEGTGDLRSDVDELIYLVPKKNGDGSMTVSTLPDKVRGEFRPITFEISAQREVRLLDEYIDTAAAAKAEADLDNDRPDIEVILDGLNAGLVKQSEIVEHCRNHKVSKRTALRILKRYSKAPNQQWTASRGMERNTIRYHVGSGKTENDQ